MDIYFTGKLTFDNTKLDFILDNKNFQESVLNLGNLININ